MHLMKSYYYILLLFLVLPAQASAVPVVLGDAASYNGFFFDNFNSSNSDSQGALAVQGNAVLDGYSVNTGNTNGGLALVAGTADQTGGNIHGDVKTEGGFNSDNPLNVNGTIHDNLGVADLPVDFRTTRDMVTETSTALKDNGVSASLSGGALMFQGDGGTDQQIFNISSDQLSGAWGLLSKDIAGNQEVIINVSGKNVNITSMDFMMKDENYSWLSNQNHVLFNFWEADTLSIETSIYGSILAPNADIIARSGMVDGQVIAKSFVDAVNGGTQLNDFRFAHNTEAAPVPEPASMVLMGIGLVGLAGIARKKTR